MSNVLVQSQAMSLALRFTDCFEIEAEKRVDRDSPIGTRQLEIGTIE
jgi:hypothetical protein